MKKKECLITEANDYQTFASVKETSGRNPLESGRATEGLIPVGQNPLTEEITDEDQDQK